MTKKKANAEWVCNSLEELNDAFHAIKSTVAGDTRFIAQALLFIAEHSIVTPKHKLSAWQTFLTQEMRRGGTMQEAAREWRRRRNANRD